MPALGGRLSDRYHHQRPDTGEVLDWERVILTGDGIEVCADCLKAATA